MGKVDLTSILRQIVIEDINKLRTEHLSTLKGYIENNLIPKISMGNKKDQISQAFASELISDIQKRLDIINHDNSLSKVGPGIQEES